MGRYQAETVTCVENHDGVISDGQASWDENRRLVVGRRGCRSLHRHFAVWCLETRLIVSGVVVAISLRERDGEHAAVYLNQWTVGLKHIPGAVQWV